MENDKDNMENNKISEDETNVESTSVEEKEEVNYTDNHNYEYVYEELSEKIKNKIPPITPKPNSNSTAQLINNPSSNREANKKFAIEIESWGMDKFNNIYPGYDENTGSNKKAELLTMINDNSWYTIPRNMLARYIRPSPERFVNNISFANKKLNMSELNLTSNGEIYKNVSAMVKLSSILKLGEIIQVPLWNSGFWVTLTPPQQRELVNLEIDLASEELELGRITNNFVYSSFSSIFAGKLSQFLVKCMDKTTLNLPIEEDILKYIQMTDLYPLLLGLLMCIYPSGIPVSISCSNNIELDEGGAPKCDYIASIKADPKKMLVVNREKLNKNMLEQMSRRAPNSVSVNEVLEYQSNINNILSSEANIQTDNGVALKVNFKIPSISSNVNSGYLWVNKIVNELEASIIKAGSSLKEEEKINVKNSLLLNAANMSILSIYSSFVNSIKSIDGNEEIYSEEVITEFLERLSLDEEIGKNFIRKIDKFIAESSVSLVAIPNFVCPKCSEEGNKNSKKVHGFKEFIPLEVIKYFLDLVNLRINITANQNLSQEFAL